MTTPETTKQFTRFYYLRQPQDTIKYNEHGAPQRLIRAGTPLALIGSKVDRTNNTVAFAVSIAHPKDGFYKRTARHIVSERLASKPFVISLEPNANGHLINQAIMNAILSDEDCHTFIDSLNKQDDVSKQSSKGYRNRQWVERTINQRLRNMARDWLFRPRWTPEKRAPEKLASNVNTSKPSTPSLTEMALADDSFILTASSLK